MMCMKKLNEVQLAISLHRVIAEKRQNGNRVNPHLEVREFEEDLQVTRTDALTCLEVSTHCYATHRFEGVEVQKCGCKFRHFLISPPREFRNDCLWSYL